MNKKLFTKQELEQLIEDNDLSNIESLIGLEIELTEYLFKIIVL